MTNAQKYRFAILISRNHPTARVLLNGDFGVPRNGFRRSPQTKQIGQRRYRECLRSVAIAMIVSVMAWSSSSSSIISSLLSSPTMSYWSRSCCKGGAFGRSCFTTSRLILGACLRRSLLRIWDLMACSRMSLLCCLNSHVEHCSMSSEGWCAVISPWPTGPSANKKLR